MRLSGFGNIPPVRRWEYSQQTRSPASAYRNAGGSNPLRTVQQLQHQQAQGLFRPTFAVEPAGYGMMPVANQGSAIPAAGLSGLGLVSSSWCDSFEQAIETLGEVVRRGEAAKLTSQNFVQAKAMYEAETGWKLWNRTPVGPTNCEGQTARVGALVVALNKELGGSSVVLPASVREQMTDAERGALPPEEMSLTAKVALIGGISVAGLIAIAVITGQVAPLLRTVKKVVS